MAHECHTFEHPADVGLEATADTLAELYAAMAEALADFICPRSGVQARQRRTISVQAEDAEALAVDFLSAVAGVIQTDRFAVASVDVTGATQNAVEAQIAGEALDPGRHDIHTEVKAVTYHLLKVAHEHGRWTGRVILDL